MWPFEQVKTNFQTRGHRVLLSSLVLMIVVTPFLQQLHSFQWLLAVFVMLMLLAAVRTVSQRPREYHVTLFLAVVALLPQFGVILDSSMQVDALRHVAITLFLFWVCGLLLRDIILRSHKVSADLIFGAINIYLMVGLAFAFIYGLIEILQPGSFSGLDKLGTPGGLVSNFEYFSFVTITTLGYGDVSPLTPFAMTAAIVEGVFGQLYLAVMVARLVGLYVSNSQDSGK